MELLTPLLALILGFTTAASFCAIYVSSSVVAYSASDIKYDKPRPLLIALGHFLSIISIGFIAIGLGLVIEDYLIYLQIPAVLFILGTGLYLIFIQKTDVCEDACDCKTESTTRASAKSEEEALASSPAKKKSTGLLGSFLFGFSSGLLCFAHILPVIGTIIAMTVLVGYVAVLLLFSYAFGHTLPILIAAYIPYVSKKFTKGKIERNIVIIRKIAGLVLVVLGIYLFWNLFDYNHKYDKYYDYYYEIQNTIPLR